MKFLTEISYIFETKINRNRPHSPGMYLKNKREKKIAPEVKLRPQKACNIQAGDTKGSRDTEINFLATIPSVVLEINETATITTYLRWI